MCIITAHSNYVVYNCCSEPCSIDETFSLFSKRRVSSILHGSLQLWTAIMADGMKN